MERNHIIGFILIFATLMLWNVATAPSKEEQAEAKRIQDSIALVNAVDITDTLTTPTSVIDTALAPSPINDSLSNQANAIKYGAFASSINGTESEEILENDFIKITFTNKGGRIKEAILKQHYKTVTDSTGKDSKELIKILNSPKNKFDYTLDVPGALNKSVKTSDLFFTAEKQGNTISFKAKAGDNGYFEQKYELLPDGYTLNYSIKTSGLSSVLASNTKDLSLYWENHLSKYEKGAQFEQSYSTVYFKEKDERRDYCNCVSDDSKDLSNKSLEWIAHTNQFFNTSLIARGQTFSSGILTTKMTDIKQSSDVKVVTSDLKIPMSNLDNGTFEMAMYVGPNEFKRLQAFDNDLEEIIPFGSSIFGTINRWFIRPFFDFLSTYIGSKGIVIILLIFLIKML
ncbi:MAG TPA: membrane protein insertase YidC, partial [Saprospiraceae bacterium]|nr:membrane protein insertase YidC [Saprospiraceae bacterium]